MGVKLWHDYWGMQEVAELPECIEHGCSNRVSPRRNWSAMTDEIAREQDPYHHRCSDCHDRKEAAEEAAWDADFRRRIVESAAGGYWRSVRARVSHQCCLCSGEIEPTSNYSMVTVSLSEGTTIRSYKVCLDCFEGMSEDVASARRRQEAARKAREDRVAERQAAISEAVASKIDKGKPCRVRDVLEIVYPGGRDLPAGDKIGDPRNGHAARSDAQDALGRFGWKVNTRRVWHSPVCECSWCAKTRGPHRDRR